MALSAGYSPRQAPLDDGHVKSLMEVLDQLPPIVVHRPTMAVIDGSHRLEAARRSGRSQVAVLFFDGSEDEALVLAVRANVVHGKPLTLSERRSAGTALLDRFPDRSDRWIGHVCGLSHSTVAKLRSVCPCAEGEEDAGAVRMGRDGRRRSLGSTGAAVGAAPSGDPGSPGSAPSPVVGILGDAALTSSPQMAGLLSWLERTAVERSDMEPFLAHLPLSRTYELSDECRRRSRVWSVIADDIEHGGRNKAT